MGVKQLFLVSVINLIFIVSVIADEKELVFVSIQPQKYFVEQLAGEFVNVKVMIEPGQVPETYEPTQRKMAALANAKLFFSIDLPFEKSLLKYLSSIPIVAPLSEPALKQSPTEIDSEHEHEHEHEHGHDPHIWLDPILVQQHVEVIHNSLVKTFPAHKAQISKNYQVFTRRLKELQLRLDALLYSSAKKNFLIFHPALGHFASRYYLNQVSIEKDGKIPSAKYLSKLLNQLNQKTVNYIIVEKQFSQKEAKTVASEIKAELLTIDPLAYSYFENMYHIATKVKQALY